MTRAKDQGDAEYKRRIADVRAHPVRNRRGANYSKPTPSTETPFDEPLRRASTLPFTHSASGRRVSSSKLANREDARVMTRLMRLHDADAIRAAKKRGHENARLAQIKRQHAALKKGLVRGYMDFSEHAAKVKQ